ncbi:MAG: hypothetical protein NTX87_00480 [Planctomycetota bacterium]|nr:hypothetical protein [Planctomycetota bacterium]
MIATPTVFVLGAGASKPYGYPTGAELRTEVLRGLGGKIEKYAPLCNCLDKDFPREVRSQFAEALVKSKHKSVDVFLETRREFERVGKLAMAYVVMCREDEGNLFSEEEIPGDWLTYLLDYMTGPFDAFGDNAVSFITFNYDRVLEHVLFNTLQHRYEEPDVECAAVLRKIPIVHVHGSLGPLPWQKSGGRPYRPLPEVWEVGNAANRIKIVCESAEEDPEFNKARTLIREAQRIYFLGFGYNKDNVERLRLAGCKEGARIYGTAIGFSDRERKDIWRLLEAQIGLTKNPRPRVGLCDGDCLQFLRNDPVRLD